MSVLYGMQSLHADELSDLISTIAGTSANKQPNTEQQIIAANNVNSAIKPTSEFHLELLDEIANIMTEDASYDFILNTVTESKKDIRPISSASRAWIQGATISKQGFLRPVPGIVTSGYGWRSQFNRMHHGVDLRLNTGDTVRVAMTGIVKRIAYDSDGYGNYVVISHPEGMETVYGHLQYALVSQGQSVTIGMPIGIGGSTGNSTGPHLHFEARMNGVAIDPTKIFNLSSQLSDSYAMHKEDKTYDQPSSNSFIGGSLAGKRTYIVRQGDTPKSVALRAGISVMRLCQLNMITDTEPLETGRMIKLK